MITFFLCLAGAVISATSPATSTNSPATNATVATTLSVTNDAVEAELEKLMEDDDAAQDEVDKWIRENQQFTAEGAGLPAAELNRRIRERFDRVRKGYEDFLRRHPKHATAHLAYASFLSDMGEEETAFKHMEKARELDPTDPAVWNNLANYYGHNSPVTKAFEYYAKAIELDPTEPVYYHNFGTTVFLFRKDAKEHYNINEQQVFDKALELYANATRLDPTNFLLASDVAQTYYGIKPPRNDEALTAWTNALSLARDEIEREGVYVHFARIKTHAGRFEEARAHLDAITNSMYADLKKRLTRVLQEKEAEAKTNSPPVKAP